MIEYITPEEWEQLPKPPPKTNQRTMELLKLLDDLEGGKIIKISVKDEKDLKGKRISLARLAGGRGYLLEFRSLPDALVVRKGAEKPPKEETPTPKRRSKKTPEAPDQ